VRLLPSSCLAVCLIALVIAPDRLSAQDPVPQGTVIPEAAAPLRASPPGTFFQGKGKQIGELTKGQTYRVLEQVAIPTLVGTQKWLKVVPQTGAQEAGWAYGGAFSDTDGPAGATEAAEADEADEADESEASSGADPGETPNQ